MHLFLHLLASLLFVIGAEGSAEELKKFQGFKHIPAWDLFKVVQESKYSKQHPFNNMCRYFFCHGATNVKCNKACDDMLPKLNNTVYERRVEKINNSTAPAIDVAECENQCEAYCGANDCSKECDSLCATHFSFADRKEYEMEFYELVGRFHN